jgi:hypothetical protein
MTKFAMKVLLTCLLLAAPLYPAEQFDVVVYGGTASGVIAAVRAARDGAKTALVNPKKHVGGMVSGGLSRTDTARSEAIGGMAREFYRLAGNHYGTHIYGNPESWYVEPHVAEELFASMLHRAKVTVFQGRQLKEKGGVRKKGAAIEAIETEDGTVFRASVFIDATYEGDLMAFAGASYIVGREPQSQYREYSAGVRAAQGAGISPYDENHNLLPGILPRREGKEGDGDRKTQAYNFRLCLSNDPGNQTPYPKPPHYDPKRYEIVLRQILAMKQRAGEAEMAKREFYVGPVPGNKTDLNNADYIGGSWDYPDASYARRREIWNDHYDYVAGYLWFLSHEPRVPAALQKLVNQWGLAKDEFTDNHNWPHELYVREARRLKGDFVMTQRDVVDELCKPDPIALGSYGLDVHAVQQFAGEDGFMQTEGAPQRTEQVRMRHVPYQIPYRALTPKRAELTNLLVSVCVSASHVAYSTIRMEPQYMMLGEAAGTAARMAVEARRPVQDIDVAELIGRLRKGHAILEAEW